MAGGRLWHSLILQRWKPIFLWLPIETLIQEKQEGYYKALNESNSLNECTPFVMFMLEVIRDALAGLKKQGKIVRKGSNKSGWGGK